MGSSTFEEWSEKAGLEAVILLEGDRGVITWGREGEQGRQKTVQSLSCWSIHLAGHRRPLAHVSSQRLRDTSTLSQC